MRPPARAYCSRSAGGAAGALATLCVLLLAERSPAANLVVNVHTLEGRALPGAVVTVRSLDGPGRQATPVHAVMDQVNRSFAPDLLVIPVGSTVMLAYLLVTDAPWYGRTNDEGSWSAEVPRGRYRVALWHPRLRENSEDLERELTVGDSDRADLTLRLSKPLQPAPLSDRPHSWDY